MTPIINAMHSLETAFEKTLLIPFLDQVERSVLLPLLAPERIANEAGHLAAAGNPVGPLGPQWARLSLNDRMRAASTVFALGLMTTAALFLRNSDEKIAIVVATVASTLLVPCLAYVMPWWEGGDRRPQRDQCCELGIETVAYLSLIIPSAGYLIHSMQTGVTAMAVSSLGVCVVGRLLWYKSAAYMHLNGAMWRYGSPGLLQQLSERQRIAAESRRMAAESLAIIGQLEAQADALLAAIAPPPANL